MALVANSVVRPITHSSELSSLFLTTPNSVSFQCDRAECTARARRKQGDYLIPIS